MSKDMNPAPLTHVQCTVQPMKTSAGTDYYVHLRNGDRTITPHMFKIEGRAEYEVAEWKWFFGQGEKPDITTFDTEVNRVMSALSATATEDGR